jgi:hypothetical protein
VYALERYILSPAPSYLSFFFPAALRWPALLYCALSAIMFCLTTAQSNCPWTETSETMNQNKYFFLLNYFSQAFFTAPKKTD